MKEKLTPDESKCLMEYMLNGYTEKTYHLDTTPFVIRTLTVSQQLEAQASMNDFKGSQLQWAQQLRLTLLSFGLESVSDKKFETQKDSYEYLIKAPDLLVNKFTQAQAKLQDEIKTLLDRSDDFSESPSSSEDSTLFSTEVLGSKS